MPCLSYKFVCVCSLSSLTWLLGSWKLINCTWAIAALELSQYTFWLMSHNQSHEDRFKWKPDLKQCRGVYLFKPWPDRPEISYLNSAFIRENVVYIFKEHKAITMTQRVSISLQNLWWCQLWLGKYVITVPKTLVVRHREAAVTFWINDFVPA